jgi:hypothetical protein
MGRTQHPAEEKEEEIKTNLWLVAALQAAACRAFCPSPLLVWFAAETLISDHIHICQMICEHPTKDPFSL